MKNFTIMLVAALSLSTLGCKKKGGGNVVLGQIGDPQSNEHDGTITCDSRVGQGTTFTLSFPSAARGRTARRTARRA